MLKSRSPVAQPSGTAREVRDLRVLLLLLCLDLGVAIMRPSSEMLLTLSVEAPTARLYEGGNTTSGREPEVALPLDTGARLPLEIDLAYASRACPTLMLGTGRRRVAEPSVLARGRKAGLGA